MIHPIEACFLAAGALMISANAMAASNVSHDAARVCIVRPGEWGSVNVSPVTIRIEPAGELTLTGEESGCIEADRAALQSVSLKFPYPYGGPGEKAQWETMPIPLRLKQNETISFILCLRPQNRDADGWAKMGWHDMWRLLPPQRQVPLYSLTG